MPKSGNFRLTLEGQRIGVQNKVKLEDATQKRHP